MSNRSIKNAPVVRLPPKSTGEAALAQAAQASLVVVGVVAGVFALYAAEYVLAPVALGIVIGLMLGPVATRLERRGVSPALSAAAVVLFFLTIVCAFAAAIATPLAAWIGRVPQIWSELQLQLSEWRQPLEALRHAREQIREVAGAADVTVSVEDGSAVENMAVLAPAVIAQVLVFFASLYFFVATRNQTRTAILAICIDRRLRWRVAHIFRDVERMVSRYLLSITAINLVEGAAVGVALFALGVPSAALWGALAALTNFIVYIGPFAMTVILFAVGLAEFDTFAGSLMPPLVYLAINAVEAQFVTPMVIGRTMTLNPFMVLLALVFWIWLWGPLGGFIAIPALLIALAIVRNLLPGFKRAERGPA
ncbi:MAG: AI-2E family transporter [Rhizobiaceae bacterium]